MGDVETQIQAETLTTLFRSKSKTFLTDQEVVVVGTPGMHQTVKGKARIYLVGTKDVFVRCDFDDYRAGSVELGVEARIRGTVREKRDWIRCQPRIEEVLVEQCSIASDD